ncbi:hypothetical protein IFM89_011318 [Coptis chinensis]|uniref:Uncharacterized protein n=1 Tax=Coptis chinensis TaxID=261450 RepID=A0A835HSI0_9MAGN|nr:hypothetical protein IFM89_011318 [Coptis chinensis]
MASFRILCVLVGFSASAILYLPNMKKQRKQQVLIEKLGIRKNRKQKQRGKWTEVQNKTKNQEVGSSRGAEASTNTTQVVDTVIASNKFQVLQETEEGNI